MTDTAITIDILTYLLPQSDSALQLDLALTAQERCNVAIQTDANERKADERETINHLEKGIPLRLSQTLEPGQSLTVWTVADHHPVQGDHVTLRTPAHSAWLFLEEVDVSRGTHFSVSITPQAIIPALEAPLTSDDFNRPLVGIQV
jgi:hypothetical protein